MSKALVSNHESGPYVRISGAQIARIATGRRANNTTVQPKNITFPTDAKRSTPRFSPAIPTTGTLAAECA